MQLTSRRYIGSKTKLLDWIFSEIEKNTVGSSFFDVFAGTGSVAERALYSYDTVKINDILLSNKIIYEAFFGTDIVDIDVIVKYKKYFNDIIDISSNYFSENYGNKYFGLEDAKKK